MFKIGIDVGGTFTDFVVVRASEAPQYFKTHSTPYDPSEGVITGLREVATAYELTPEALLGSTELLIHGTTVATNTLVERKGAKVGLLTTAGFRDLLEMREGMHHGGELLCWAGVRRVSASPQGTLRSPGATARRTHHAVQRRGGAA